MWRGVTFLLAAFSGAALVGCPDWSRPDPRLHVERAPATEAPPAAAIGVAGDTGGAEAERQPASTAAPTGVDTLRAGVLELKGATGAPDALERLDRLQSLGFDLLERGTPDEQREAEALLEELSDLRVDIVERRAGG